MVARIRVFAFTVAGLSLFAAAALAAPVPAEQDEASLNARRAEWIEQIHRAAPGTDWRAIERANRLETAFRRQDDGYATGAGSPWTERGAMNVTGRNWDGAFTSGGELLVGSANGGLFRGVPGGPWTPLTDNVGYGVEHVLVAPGAPDRILIASNSVLHVSVDGGANWSVPTGLPDAIWTVARTVQEADAPLTMYALVEGWIWTGTAWDHNWHLLRSTNGGASFVRVHTEPLATRPDIWISRIGPGPIYMAVGNTFKRSLDHGVTWSNVGTLPATGTNVRLAGSEAGAPTFYCALQPGTSWTLYRSTNAGASWSSVSAMPDFYGTLTATITNASEVLYGGIDCHRSMDGGGTFALVNNWFEYYGDEQTKLHADIFGLRCLLEPVVASADPKTLVPGPNGVALQEVIWVHTDGGTYRMLPGLTAPDNATRVGFDNAQYYGTLTSLESPDVIFAGSQDQGYQISHPGLGTSAPDFTQVISGDYAHLVSSWPDRSRMVWSVYPGFVMLQTGTGNTPDLEFSDFPAGEPGFRFLPATAADPLSPSGVWVGARRLWHLVRTAPGTFTWTALTQDFDHGDGDVVGAIAWAPSSPDRGIVATYNSRMYFTTNRGATWNESAFFGPPSHFFAGSSVVISPVNPLIAWVGGSGYSNPGVFKTTDGGATWAPMATGLPSTQVFAIALESDRSPVLYAATQAGPFRWDGSSWQNLLLTTCCAPLTDYWHVESVPNHGIARFSTYGRGLWDYATGATLSAPSTAGSRLAIAIAPNPAGPRSNVSFALSAPGLVSVEVFDVTGQRVRTLASGWRAAGPQRFAFDHRAGNGRALESGLYLVRVRTPEGAAVQRLVIAH